MKNRQAENRLFRMTGFTLIELIVVIFIIALLAGMIAYGLSYYHRGSRNAKRKADMGKVQLGLENFYAQYKVYPNPSMNDPDPARGVIQQFGDDTDFECGPENKLRISGFSSVNECISYNGYMDIISKDAKDALDDKYKYRYAVKDDAVNWEASAYLEPPSKELTGDGGDDSSRYEVGSDKLNIFTPGSASTYNFRGTATSMY